MNCDVMIEKGSIFLRNLNTYNIQKDVWSAEKSTYAVYTASYEKLLSPERLYYQRFTYRYTTTNQSPSWAIMYIQGGEVWGARIDNPLPNTEYTQSLVTSINMSSKVLSSGTIYNGVSGQIDGVKSQCKNVLLYDVTDLYSILKAYGLALDTTELKEWCDENLDYVPRYTNYDISDLIQDSINKIYINKGTVLCNEIIETDGLRYYGANSGVKTNSYFDLSYSLPCSVYNNLGNGNVTTTLVSAVENDSPLKNEHKNIMKVVTNGQASPNAGGIMCLHVPYADGIFIERFVAKLPVGYKFIAYYNPQGDGAVITWLTSKEGTGDWKEYAILYKCGSTGTFYAGGHIAVDGTDNTNVTWYLACIINADITGKEYLKNFSILQNKTQMKDGNIFISKLDERNMIPNGDCSKAEPKMLPKNWYYDEEDVAGNGYRSIVQPVGAVAMSAEFGGKFKIDPTARYKISFWVKCKRDMTSFLTAIKYCIGNVQIAHINVSFVSGTKTQLTQELKSGDTEVKVKTNNAWQVKSYSRLGFRSTRTKSWNDMGYSNGGSGTNGIVAGVSGTDTINLSVPYSGDTIPINTYIVESYDGGNFPYPLAKADLPDDNTWKYVEGYFGGTTKEVWDGENGGWRSIPHDVTDMFICLNIYTNNGSVPIKYCDVRVEQVANGECHRLEQKIQIKEFD